MRSPLGTLNLSSPLLESAAPTPRRARGPGPWWVGGLLATLSLACPMARAAAAAAPDEDSTLAEVVVTANKRAQDTKDVPVSIGVVDSQEILDLHIEDAEAISCILPAVSFAAHNNGPNGPGQDNLTIRGVSSTVGNPTVSTYIDEVP